MLKQISAVLSAPVLELESGNLVGRVESLISDEKGQKILAFLARPSSGLFRPLKAIAPIDIVEYGPEFIVVRQKEALLKPEEIAYLPELMKQNINPLQKPVITPQGKKLGRVSDLVIEDNSASILKYYLSPLPLGFLSGYDLILGAEQIVRVESRRVIAREEPVKLPRPESVLPETGTVPHPTD